MTERNERVTGTTGALGPSRALGGAVRGPRPGSRRHLGSTGDLVRKAGKGDERAWSELVRRFRPMVLRVARSVGLNAADAADVEQATWVQLMRYGDQVRDPDRVGAWLATTARRQSQRLAMARSSQVLAIDPLTYAGSARAESDDVADVIVSGHYEAVLERALGRLPGRYRQVLELLASQASPSYEEVARRMDLPVGSIGPTRLRGLQMLRRDAELQRLAHRPPSSSLAAHKPARHPAWQ